MKSISLYLRFVLLAAPFTWAQAPAVTAQANTVFAGADGKFEAPPDSALVQFNISAQADTAKAAYDRASKQAEQTRDILRSQGIDPKTAQVGAYSIEPMYDWKTAKRQLVGYRVTTNVILKLKEFVKIGPITQQLADAAVSESQSINYTLENMEEAKSKAVEDAYHRARASADSVAKAAGRSVVELSYASVDTFENVRPVAMMVRPMMAMKAEATPAPTEEFTPQSVNVTAHVNALFTLK
ncbi:MAG TPA: SIMPL domain-containing protein [Terriglobales bacterium]|nr:SIMPL domain-containing protein [Terriglobales bacterium]